MKSRIAIAENFNGSRRVEVYYELGDDNFELRFTKAGLADTSTLIPKLYLEEVQTVINDLVDMKKQYHAI